MKNNQLYYGDNLDILRDHIPDESVDLIYLDPPFNSNRNYNVLFRDESGDESEAQITAFEDTWHWGETAEDTYDDLVRNAPSGVDTAISAMMTLLGRNQMTAYLVMMTARLVELHRVLKPTGSLYLHCDPTASHYLKIILDAIFGVENFGNEVIWKRTTAHNDSKTMGNTHDVILYYTKTDDFIWNKQYQPYDESYIKSHYRRVTDDGRHYRTSDLTAYGLTGGGYTYEWNGVTKIWRVPEERMQELHDEGRVYYTRTGSAEYIRYLDEMPGVPIQDVWSDISPINSQSAERLGYPTQKPVELLERIISASSNEGDVILDPFCGCGTAISAAQKLKRKWIGIDVTYLSISLQKYRLKEEFDLTSGADYDIIGVPTTLDAAKALATDSENDGRYQFQFWALSLVDAKPLGGQVGGRSGKRGSDKGIDGTINFYDGHKKNYAKVIVQVKSGKVKSGDIRDLVGTVKREKAAIGVFITLENSTRDMEKEAVSAGYYESVFWEDKYRKIQILTIEQLLDDRTIDMPPAYLSHKQAQRIKQVPDQKRLF